MNARHFASSLVTEFQQCVHANPKQSEEDLFLALRCSLCRLSTRFNVEVYHGTSHLVQFSNALPPLPNPAKCELADLMFLVMGPSRNVPMRLSFMQAKKIKVPIAGKPPVSVNGATLRFDANIKQWHLLANRPQLDCVPPLLPPRDLLNGALLSSVGTFGIFYQDISGHVDMCYARAIEIVPLPSNRRSPVRPHLLQYPTQTKHQVVTAIGTYAEASATRTLRRFAGYLWNMRIGTPLMGGAGHSPITSQLPLERWLKGILLGIRSSGPGAGEVLGEALDRMADISAGNGSGTPVPANLVLIKASVGK